jgi:hypothetical protein
MKGLTYCHLLALVVMSRMTGLKHWRATREFGISPSAAAMPFHGVVKVVVMAWWCCGHGCPAAQIACWRPRDNTPRASSPVCTVADYMYFTPQQDDAPKIRIPSWDSWARLWASPTATPSQRWLRGTMYILTCPMAILCAENTRRSAGEYEQQCVTMPLFVALSKLHAGLETISTTEAPLERVPCVKTLET